MEINWIDIETKLPNEFEKVLLMYDDTIWVGFFHNHRTLGHTRNKSWWCVNPNKNYSPILVTKTPKYWSSLQPERLNPEAPKGDAIV